MLSDAYTDLAQEGGNHIVQYQPTRMEKLLWRMQNNCLFLKSTTPHLSLPSFAWMHLLEISHWERLL